MSNAAAVRRILWRILFLKLGAAIVKLVVGYLTSSLALVADGFNSTFDVAGSAVGLLGVQVAARPADEDHPYGHGKAETIATLAICVLLFITAWELARSAIARLLDPTLIQAEVGLWSFGAMFISLGFNAFILANALSQGRRLRSEVLIATATDTRVDVIIAISVLLGLAAVRMGYPIVDPLLALGVALLIAKAGVGILSPSLPTLMDRAALSADQVSQLALGVPGVQSVHQVRSRGRETDVYADLHIRVAPDMSTERAHAIAHEVQHRLREQRPDIQDVTIHVEPQGHPDVAPAEDVTARIRRLALGMNLDLHDVWAHTVQGKRYVEMHLETDGQLSLSEAHDLASALEGRVRSDISDLAEVTTHMEPRGELVARGGDDPDAPRAAGAEVARAICQTVDSLLGGDTCHNVHIYGHGRGWDASFHCRLPGEMPLAEAHRACSRVEEEVRARVRGLERVIVHTEPRRDPRA